MSERATLRQRRIIAQRALDCCEYCLSQAHFCPQSFSVEHIVPKSQGGTTTLDNLALSCQGCNNFKYTKVTGADPTSDIIVPLYHPRKDTWAEHFSWSEDKEELIGRTPVGRATIETLRLNRPNVVNLRRALVIIGEHPPKLHHQS